jgi:hypothetical protein
MCCQVTRSALPHSDGDDQQDGPGCEEDRKEQNDETHPDGAPRAAGQQAMPEALRAQSHVFPHPREPHVCPGANETRVVPDEVRGSGPGISA